MDLCLVITLRCIIYFKETTTTSFKYPDGATLRTSNVHMNKIFEWSTFHIRSFRGIKTLKNQDYTEAEIYTDKTGNKEFGHLGLSLEYGGSVETNEDYHAYIFEFVVENGMEIFIYVQVKRSFQVILCD